MPHLGVLSSCAECSRIFHDILEMSISDISATRQLTTICHTYEVLTAADEFSRMLYNRIIDFRHLRRKTVTAMCHTFRGSLVCWLIFHNVLWASRKVHFRHLRQSATLRGSFVCWRIFHVYEFLENLIVDISSAKRLGQCATLGDPLRILLNVTECSMTSSKPQFATTSP